MGGVWLHPVIDDAGFHPRGGATDRWDDPLNGDGSVPPAAKQCGG